MLHPLVVHLMTTVLISSLLIFSRSLKIEGNLDQMRSNLWACCLSGPTNESKFIILLPKREFFPLIVLGVSFLLTRYLLRLHWFLLLFQHINEKFFILSYAFFSHQLKSTCVLTTLWFHHNILLRRGLFLGLLFDLNLKVLHLRSLLDLSLAFSSALHRYQLSLWGSELGVLECWLVMRFRGLLSN